jgi:hypothetical protein
MSEVRTLKCDECSKLRLNDSNHWIEGASSGHEIFLAPLDGLSKILIAPKAGTATEKTWKNIEELKHFCGQECAMKWVGIKLASIRVRP